MIETKLETNRSSISSKEENLTATVDVGNLFCFEPTPLDSNKLITKTKEDYLRALAQQSTQLVIEKLFKLPRERVEDELVVNLPKRTTLLPREKSLPKAQPLTKWEKYAKMKGITKKKRSRMVYDEVHQEYRPRYGYKRKDDVTKDWLIEIKKNEDPNQDFFAKRTLERNERVAKNELQRLQNIARASKQPTTALTTAASTSSAGLKSNKLPDMSNKFEIKKALNIAKQSDASLSKFSDKLKNEEKVVKGFGKKRKFESNFGDLKLEKERQLKLLDKIRSNADKSSKNQLNLEKVVNKHMNSKESSETDGKKTKSKRRSSAGVKPRKPQSNKKSRK